MTTSHTWNNKTTTKLIVQKLKLLLTQGNIAITTVTLHLLIKQLPCKIMALCTNLYYCDMIMLSYNNEGVVFCTANYNLFNGIYIQPNQSHKTNCQVNNSLQLSYIQWALHSVLNSRTEQTVKWTTTND
jgi:hypothetical protein